MGWGRVALLRKGESPICQVTKGKKKKRGGEAGGVSQQRESAFLFQMPLKPILPHGRAGPGGSHPIMNKWGGAGVVPSQVRVVWSIPRQPTSAPNFSYFQPALLSYMLLCWFWHELSLLKNLIEIWYSFVRMPKGFLLCTFEASNISLETTFVCVCVCVCGIGVWT
jgi:hypothetical protein